MTRTHATSNQAGRFELRVPAYAVGTFTYRAEDVDTGAVSPAVELRVDGRGNPRHWATRYPQRLYRWDPCHVITYRVNHRWGHPTWRRQVTGAIARISRQSGLRFRELGSTRFVPRPGTPNPRGVDLVIAWLPRRSTPYLSQPRHRNAMAVSDTTRIVVPTVEGDEPSLSDGRVVIDEDFQRYQLPGFGAGGSLGTQGRLLMHEIGHVLGLGHVDEIPSTNRLQIMFPYMTRGIAAWGAGDATGFEHVGAAAGCFAPTDADAPVRVVRRSEPIS